MPTITIHRQGLEGQPVIVVDDFASEPDRLIDDAEMLHFLPIGDYYPGVRAPVPGRLVTRMLSGVADLIRDTFETDDALDRFEAFYSLVTTAPQALRPIQRLPHFDGVEPGRLAVLLFLCREDQGGTAFYRHRATGFETVNAARLTAFDAALRTDVNRHGLPRARYISGDTPLYEQIARYDGRFNRALIYRGHTLHCADVPDRATLSGDPRVGRLTVNVFLNTDGGR
jgi:hypothetical protein